MDCPAAHPLTPRFAAEENDCPAAVPDRAVLTSCPEKECVRRLRMVMALERVGHRLPYAVSRGYAAQKTSPVIGHSTAYNSDQFRIYCAVYCLSVTFQLVIGIGRP